MLEVYDADLVPVHIDALPSQLVFSGDYEYFHTKVNANPIGYYQIPKYDAWMVAWYRRYPEKYYALIYHEPTRKFGSTMNSYNSTQSFVEECKRIWTSAEHTCIPRGTKI